MVSKLYGYGIIEEAYPGLSQTWSNGTSMKFRFNRMPCFWIFSSLIEMYVCVSEGKKRYLFGKFCVRSTWATPRNMKITSSF